MATNPENQSAYCYQQLVLGMQQSRIQPGDYLREQTLAKDFGVSRTPVREALRKLETEGLIHSEPRLGMRVRALDYAEVIELYEVREVHERAVARLAATKANEIELSELKSLQTDLERAKNDAVRMAALNLRFHLSLLQIAKNRFLTRAVETMQRTMLLLGPSTLSDPKRAQTAIKEHRALILALEKCDPDKAESIMSEHLQNAQRYRIRQIQRDSP